MGIADYLVSDCFLDLFVISCPVLLKLNIFLQQDDSILGFLSVYSELPGTLRQDTVHLRPKVDIRKTSP